ncbi:MAG: MBL fold metallo-hydrolase [Candidatus Woesearchaeota archaeon]
MKITKYPQSCILVNYKSKNILIDPGAFVYQQTDLKPEDWKNIDIILLTHEHFDHVDIDAIKIILKNNNPTILTNRPVHNLLLDNSIKSIMMHPGDLKIVDGIHIKGEISEHGPLPNGKPAPEVIGFLIDDKIYHPGDTVYLVKKPYADVVFVPICGTVVMDAKQAARFVNDIQCKLAIPIHYSNPKYPTGANEFERQMMKNTSVKYKVLAEKETIEVDE